VRTVPPLVSIVLPTFNRLKYLRSTVESVHAQTCQDWELIIVDDGSNEETKEYLATLHSPPRTRVIWLSHGGIPARTRNGGLRAATGKFVAFLDSDDLWSPNKLDTQINAISRSPRCGWSYSAFVTIAEHGAVLSTNETEYQAVLGGNIFPQVVMGAAPIRTPAVVANRELLMQVGLFDESVPSAEDCDLWMRLALHSEVAVVHEPLVTIRRHAENYSNNWTIAFAGRGYALLKLQSIAGRRWLPLLRRERARNGLTLAAQHATLRDYSNMWRAFFACLPYAWPYAECWSRLLKMLTHPFMPPRLLLSYHAYRRKH
jgi:glycosyltransferase involved in cell wall biosynthesis